METTRPFLTMSRRPSLFTLPETTLENKGGQDFRGALQQNISEDAVMQETQGAQNVQESGSQIEQMLQAKAHLEKKWSKAISLKRRLAAAIRLSGEDHGQHQQVLLCAHLVEAQMKLLCQEQGQISAQVVNLRQKTLTAAMLEKIVDQTYLCVEKGGRAKFTFALKGEVLGGLQISVCMQEGGLKAIFVVENPEIQKLLDQGLQDLKRQLQDRGIFVRDLEIRDPEEKRREQRRKQHQRDREQDETECDA